MVECYLTAAEKSHKKTITVANYNCKLIENVAFSRTLRKFIDIIIILAYCLDITATFKVIMILW